MNETEIYVGLVKYLNKNPKGAEGQMYLKILLDTGQKFDAAC